MLRLALAPIETETEASCWFTRRPGLTRVILATFGVLALLIGGGLAVHLMWLVVVVAISGK